MESIKRRRRNLGKKRGDDSLNLIFPLRMITLKWHVLCRWYQSLMSDILKIKGLAKEKGKKNALITGYINFTYSKSWSKLIESLYECVI